MYEVNEAVIDLFVMMGLIVHNDLRDIILIIHNEKIICEVITPAISKTVMIETLNSKLMP